MDKGEQPLSLLDEMEVSTDGSYLIPSPGYIIVYL